MREPDVRDLQATLRNAVSNIAEPSERAAAEEALDGILRHYESACVDIGELLSDKGRLGDQNVVTFYSGEFTRPRKIVFGDAEHMCIFVLDSENEPREIYRGEEFTKANIPQYSRQLNGNPII